MKSKTITVLLCVISAALAVGLTVSLVQIKKHGDEIARFKGDVLTTRDVGIKYINYETIVGADYDSLNPNFIKDENDLEKVKGILKSLEGAVFKRADKPDELHWIDSVSIKTVSPLTNETHKYSIGIRNNSVLYISIDGETKYYKCSAMKSFRNALFTAQDRPLGW